MSGRDVMENVVSMNPGGWPTELRNGEMLHCIVAWVAKGGQMSIDVGVLIGRSGEEDEFRNEAKLTYLQSMKLLIDVEDACMALLQAVVVLPPNDNVHLNGSHKPLYGDNMTNLLIIVLTESKA
ncbi:hypothetical protein WUBG_08499 [Wuchereria bancrofti]|uniref:Uncharacterized protein n=1 Tax=Wuchereria bancrofti TaxID=6293 RepID=J9EEN7_WUCBA|nr:hypothetical protein WUBG_08499 [Wuchereria bancrofti]